MSWRLGKKSESRLGLGFFLRLERVFIEDDPLVQVSSHSSSNKDRCGGVLQKPLSPGARDLHESLVSEPPCPLTP